jgi:hypothetical protein
MDPAQDSSREAKRARFLAPRPRAPWRPSSGAVVAAIAGALLVAGAALVLLAPALGLGGVRAATKGHGAYPLLRAQGGGVRLPLSPQRDGRVHFYTWAQGEQAIEFFAVRAGDGSVHTAFNACEVCFPYREGYRQEGDEVVCNECGQRFPFEKIGVVSGGCDPVPLPSTVVGEEVVIRVEDLLKGARLY